MRRRHTRDLTREPVEIAVEGGFSRRNLLPHSRDIAAEVVGGTDVEGDGRLALREQCGEVRG
ncbi:MAG: hypothetical protein ACXVJO_15760, partial [Thermoanaerobaculia bacterium]